LSWLAPAPSQGRGFDLAGKAVLQDDDHRSLGAAKEPTQRPTRLARHSDPDRSVCWELTMKPSPALPDWHPAARQPPHPSTSPCRFLTAVIDCGSTPSSTRACCASSSSKTAGVSWLAGIGGEGQQLTDDVSMIDSNAAMTGSISSRSGVMEVIKASIRPAIRCRSGLSFSSLSSKISGLKLSAVVWVDQLLGRDNLQYGNDVRESSGSVHV
jgi:hypothetical protein